MLVNVFRKAEPIISKQTCVKIESLRFAICVKVYYSWLLAARLAAGFLPGTLRVFLGLCILQ